jgi:hypothetical protein
LPYPVTGLLFSGMKHDDPLDLYRRRLAEIELELLPFARLTAERDALVALVRRLENLPGPRVAGRHGTHWTYPAGAGVPITPAIIDHVRLNPGITGPELADYLADLVKTTRPDARHALIARTSELIKKGQLKRDKEGRIFLVDNAVT